ncbi:MAG: SagB/ThcOx family dehydrogenase [Paracoccaceae bacterium]|nr:SagB/ThcOx family dehydrogenase [Paracoccaceae bacterium]
MTLSSASLITLPQPSTNGGLTLEQAIAHRRSVREFEGGSVSLAQLGQLLWAAQGVTHPRGLRAVPSAGALYPLELYAIAADSGDIEAGVYHYRPDRHGLDRLVEGDFRSRFAAAALRQTWIERASVILVVVAVHARTMAKYGNRGRRYVAIEAGHCAQDIYLQAVSLELGATEVGAFSDAAVSRLLRLPEGQEPVTSIAVGQPFSEHPP